ncbi:hypothetical protein A9G11_03755 [Gilliamella sp. wkB108]|uniref:DUF4424 family protein n=1 Tax=Gilliamella sp. wkB108 TaxID=3120256 RepID=UPI00080EC98E|nr:DUF4424 family protein [Gilliamella apicola]OCG24206.1 hypothetical protein A9G11_03755 [Gilliamella apicola]
MVNKLFLLGLALLSFGTFANDSTGYVGTGGINYIKNINIAMETEDLFISKEKIDVAYQFKNLTDHDITETIVFPLPIMSGLGEGDYADTERLLNSFQVLVDDKIIIPNRHVRIAFYPNIEDEYGVKLDFNHNDAIDVTAEIMQCGVTESMLLNTWTRKESSEDIDEKIDACQNQTLKQLADTHSWGVQVIYSWQQTFKGNAITKVKHHYNPLVGGGIIVFSDLTTDEYKNFCVDNNFMRKLKQSKLKPEQPTIPSQELSYILTTGANWAKPIGTFTLTIEREPDEIVSLCWDESLQKINATQFRAVKTDFIPKQDIYVLFL